MADNWRERVTNPWSASKGPAPSPETEAKKVASNGKSAAKKKEPNDEIKAPKNFRGLGNIWFDASSNIVWRENEKNEWINYNEAQFKRLLKFNGYDQKTPRTQTISPLDSMMLSIQEHRRLDFCGAIAGYQPGLAKICGSRVLITKGPNLIKPKKGSWETIKTVFQELLLEQRKYLYAWIKSAFESLNAGFPWRPGQLLVFAGPHDCGKSLGQNLITEILGGRVCKPYDYLIGESNFNASFFACEHWEIEDEASSTDIRTRRHFGAMLKNALVNQVQHFRAMYRDGISATPFLRMTMSVNDNPESLMVLPPIEDDIKDKIILLQATKVTIPGSDKDPERRNKFWKRLIREIPAFLYEMEEWQIPDDIRSTRFGVQAWHNPALVKEVDQLSPEWQLLNLIDTVAFFPLGAENFWGTALEVERALREADKSGEVSRLLKFSSACGVYLSRLAKKCKERVELDGAEGNTNRYIIKKKK